MKKQFLLNLGVLSVALTYAATLHAHTPGINTFLFSGVVLSWLFHLHPEARKSRVAWMMATLTVVSSILVVWVHSSLAMVVHFGTLFSTAGFVQRRELRFIGFALLLVLTNLINGPRAISQQFNESDSARPFFRRALRYFPLVILPGGLVFVFLVVYMIASPTLLDWVLDILETLVNWVLDLQVLKWGWQLLIGIVVGVLLLYPMFNEKLLNWIGKSKERLVRVRRKNFRGNPLGLLHEHRVAIGLLATLNGLTFIYQIGAFRDLLVKRDAYHAAQHLSHQVHFATYALIFSVLLAMGVLLYYFRGNQHFFPKNHSLKALALVWLGQNLLLLLVVAGYNFQYIEAFGLAYKRIGVLFFLVAVMAGLGFTGVKILRTKTLYYLFQRNAWVVYALLFLGSAVNWEVVITRYNLFVATEEPLDLVFLLNDMSTQNLYLLQGHWELIEDRIGEQLDQDVWLEAKIDAFEQQQQEKTWLSWNWPDHRNAPLLPEYD
jgi:hypothetical protein